MLYARERKIAVGHLGTLDPQAAGVLPVAIGKATRLIPLLADRRKAYVCTLMLGRSTTTQDASGETVDARPVPDDWALRIEAVRSALRGQDRANAADVLCRASRRQATVRAGPSAARRSSGAPAPRLCTR